MGAHDRNQTSTANVADGSQVGSSHPGPDYAPSGHVDAAFRTERMAVFRLRMGKISEDFSAPREVFVGFRTDVHRPQIAVSALICRAYGLPGNLPAVDWLEVSTEFRRQGIATEMLDGLEAFLGSRLEPLGRYAELEASLNRLRRKRGAEEVTDVCPLRPRW